jgi:hypothetical protein
MRKQILILFLSLLMCLLSACALPRKDGAAETKTGSDPRISAQTREEWKTLFYEGAEGQSVSGEKYYFAFYSRSDLRSGALMILSADGTSLLLYELGEIVMEDGHLVIVDRLQGNKMPFDVTVKEVEGGFEMLFMDGDAVDMYFVDRDTILGHMNEIADRLG